MNEVASEVIQKKIEFVAMQKEAWSYDDFRNGALASVMSGERYIPRDVLPQSIDLGDLGRELTKLGERTRKTQREWGRKIYASIEKKTLIAGQASSGDNHGVRYFQDKERVRSLHFIGSMHTHPEQITDGTKSFYKARMEEVQNSLPRDISHFEKDRSPHYFSLGDLRTLLFGGDLFKLVEHKSRVLMAVRTELTPFDISRDQFYRNYREADERSKTGDQAVVRLCESFGLTLYEGDFSENDSFVLTKLDTTS